MKVETNIMRFDFDCVVVGAGVIGLAIGRAIAKSALRVLVIEQENQIALHTSSRNSEVIHAGIYYSQNSLKAKFCNEGRKELYTYCTEFGVPHNQIGKLIVAGSDDEVFKLNEINENARSSGGPKLEFLSEKMVKKLEPELKCAAALYSRETGIIDSHQYMLSLLGQLKNFGGELAINSKLTYVEELSGGFKLIINTGNVEPFEITTKVLVNAAGLYAWDVAAPLYNVLERKLPPQYFAKGTYFVYNKESPFSHLIYPVPQDGGLGVHVTLDMSGALRFGPDVEWVDNIDYQINADRKEEFVQAIIQYYPALDREALVPAFSGVRPRTSAPEYDNDFMIESLLTERGGVSVHLFGIESPGLTSSLAIADHVTKQVKSFL